MHCDCGTSDEATLTREFDTRSDVNLAYVAWRPKYVKSLVVGGARVIRLQMHV